MAKTYVQFDGEKIKRLRENSLASLETVAEATGLGRHTIAHAEQGRKLELKSARAIVHYFQVPFDEIGEVIRDESE